MQALSEVSCTLSSTPAISEPWVLDGVVDHTLPLEITGISSNIALGRAMDKLLRVGKHERVIISKS